jgi:hypothetical protein
MLNSTTIELKHQKRGKNRKKLSGKKFAARNFNLTLTVLAINQATRSKERKSHKASCLGLLFDLAVHSGKFLEMGCNGSKSDGLLRTRNIQYLTWVFCCVQTCKRAASEFLSLQRSHEPLDDLVFRRLAARPRACFTSFFPILLFFLPNLGGWSFQR